jgi:hypothetical protein
MKRIVCMIHSLSEGRVLNELGFQLCLPFARLVEGCDAFCLFAFCSLVFVPFFCGTTGILIVRGW